jgi:hypothetical protein
MFTMTGKRFWMLVTFGGVAMFIAGLVLTIVLTIETGERLPDSECSSARASVMMVCYTSDDPKVLLGVGPMLLGGGMVGVGIWRWTAASRYESADDDDDDSVSTISAPPPPPPPPPDEVGDPLAEIEAIRRRGKRSKPPPSSG